MRTTAWPMAVLCLAVNLVCPAVQDAGSENEIEGAQVQALKAELKFDEWVNKTREGREILVVQLNFGSVLRADIKSQAELYEAPFPSYRVVCSRSAEGEATLDMTFEVRILPSMREARELMLKYIAHLTAPLSYLRKLWAEDKPLYGDVSFGRNFWSTGNLLFILDDRKHQRFVDEVFESIDAALRVWPEEDSEVTAPDEEKDLTVRSRYVKKEQEWEIVLEKLPELATVVLSSVNWETRKEQDNVLRIRPKQGTEGGPAYLVVLENGKRPRYVHVPMQKSSSQQE